MKNRILTLVPVILLLVLTSCMDTVNTTENYQKAMRPDPVDVKRVVTDSFLKGRLRLLRVDRQNLDDGFMKVQATFKSERTGAWDWFWYGEKPYKITYRFMWYNKAGMEVVTGASTWLEKDIWPGDTVTITSISPNPQCKDFMLKMRELNR